MDQEKLTDLEWLRKLYIENLSEMVKYGTNTNFRPRVKHPGKWAKLESVISLKEGVKKPLIIPPIDQNRKVWVWSDTHFFHKNIIHFSGRPYGDVNQMNECLIANYNDCVSKDDICIWVGDVGFKGTTYINKILEKCNGYKILVIGNHDFNGKKLRHLEFDETHLIYIVNCSGLNLVFTHYPMYNIIWPWVNVHGHLHFFPNPDSGHILHINVNCEIQDYKPKLLNDIIKQARVRIIADKM